ncbi:MAG TPA: hypothetical protein VF146_16205 [Bryobacteraceae bacterium]
MAEEGNGHSSPPRLDRIERAIEALIDGHERLVASQKQLLTAQVVMTDTVSTLGRSVDELVKKVDAHEDRIQALIDSQLRVDETLASIKKILERPPSQN